MYVRADHSLYTADQLMRHELGHDMIAKGEVDINAVREKLTKKAGKENVDKIAELYNNAYAGTGMTAEEIWEECICDSLGEMNIFSYKRYLANCSKRHFLKSARLQSRAKHLFRQEDHPREMRVGIPTGILIFLNRNGICLIVSLTKSYS